MLIATKLLNHQGKKGSFVEFAVKVSYKTVLRTGNGQFQQIQRSFDEKYPFRQILDSNRDIVREWAKEHCSGTYNIVNKGVWFSKREDALLAYIRFKG